MSKGTPARVLAGLKMGISLAVAIVREWELHPHSQQTLRDTAG